MAQHGWTLKALPTEIHRSLQATQDFPGGSAGKESACNAGDPGSPEQLERPAGFPSSDKTRPDSPWDSPGKNTGEGCHFPLQKKL